MGGVDPNVSNGIDYVTISSTGNATDFGDLTVARYYAQAVSSGTRAVNGSGPDTNSNASNVMDYITIASTGNATDWGDWWTTTTSEPMGTFSNSHGGIS